MNKQWICLLAFLAIGHAQAASFDCGKASTKVEKLICADESLSERDEQMAEAYRTALKQAAAPEALKKRQLQWLKDLRRYCKTAKCVEGTYWARTRALEDGEGARVYDAPDLKARKEADKAAKVKALLTQYPMRLNVGPRTEKHREFCNRFYEALRTASPEIQYIEPVFRTDDPTHPALGEYLYCDLYEPKRAYVYFVLSDLGTRGFRLYRLDMDRNRKNGLEEYLYGQEPEYGDISAQLIRVGRGDWEECTVADRVPASPEHPGQARDGSTGINALIRYRGRYFFYDLEHIGSNNYNFELVAYDPGRRDFSAPDLCRWDAPHDK